MASLNPELITEIAGYPVTNTVVATVIVDILLIAFIFFVARRITMIPKRVQNATEILISYFYEMSKSLSGNRAKTVFPWVMTFFIFILVSNLLGLMPGIGSIGIYPEQNTSKANVEKKTGMIKSGDEIIKDPHKEIEDESHPQPLSK